MTMQWVNHCHCILADDVDGEEAASAAAVRRVAGARSDGTQSEFGAEEQQPIHRDEQGVSRRDCTLLEVDKDVPKLEDQATILHST